MTRDVELVDVPAGMAWAVAAPALAGGLLGMAGGPGLAFAVFLFALGIAGAHVVLLALPLHGFLHMLGWRSGAATVLASAFVIGAFPATLLFDIDIGVWGGLFGLIGGGAFCAVSLARNREIH
jgi:hypothetical protein